MDSAALLRRTLGCDGFPGGGVRKAAGAGVLLQRKAEGALAEDLEVVEEAAVRCQQIVEGRARAPTGSL